MCTSAEHLPHSSDRLQSFHQNLNLAAVVSILGCLQAAFIFLQTLKGQRCAPRLLFEL